MMTLADLDLTGATLPDGLRLRREQFPVRAVILHGDAGALELWQGTVGGGLEIHAAAPGPGLLACGHCHILAGPCWTAAADLLWRQQFAPLVAAGQRAAVVRRLHEHYTDVFGGRA